MNLEKLLSLESPPDNLELSPEELKAFFYKYKELQKELDKEKRSCKHVIEENTGSDKSEAPYKKCHEARKSMKMAQRVQKAIINSELLPSRKEFKIAYKYKPMEEVGGDLFDIIRVGKNKYGFMIADVSGHGISAAMISVLAKAYFNIYDKYLLSPGEIIKMVNSNIFKFIGDMEYYLTTFYALLDLETNKLQFSSAGHPTAILIKKGKKPEELKTNHGLFIGISQDSEWETTTVNIESGDRVLFYTDGIIEARDDNKNFFSRERLISFTKENSHLEIQDFIDSLMVKIREFSNGHPQEDDMAVLLLEYLK